MLPIPNPHDPATPVRIPTRSEVRALARQMIQMVEAAIERGENDRHVTLDCDDRINAYAAALSEVHGEDAAEVFLLMWAEESAAAAEHFAQESEQAVARSAAEMAQAEHEMNEIVERHVHAERTGQYIGALLMVALLLFVGWMFFG